MNAAKMIRAALVFGATLISFTAPALATQTKVIASCYGEHHGSYLKLRDVYGSEGLAQTVITVTTDNEEAPPRFFVIEEVSKNFQPLQPKAFSWAIRQAIKASAANEWYGYVKVRALDSNGVVLYLNLQKYTGFANALVIDGNVEQLTCNLVEG